MGMYDSVLATCPHCGGVTEVQSKAGDCILSTFSTTDVPYEIAASVSNELQYCDHCGEKFIMELKEVITTSLRVLKVN